jgi:hypothetical protein
VDEQTDKDRLLSEALARLDDLEAVVDKLSEAILERVPPETPRLRVVGRDGS